MFYLDFAGLVVEADKKITLVNGCFRGNIKNSNLPDRICIKQKRVCSIAIFCIIHLCAYVVNENLYDFATYYFFRRNFENID